MTEQRFQRERGFHLASFKAVGDGTPTGEFEAVVSVFGNVDRGGDRIAHGAFSKSLARWKEKGDPIPVLWNHMWDNPDAHIGAVDPADATENETGLHVKGHIDLDSAFGAQVYRLLSQRRVKEFSFGYDVKDSKRDDKGVLDLLEIDLIELGPTLKGMNPETELLAVKALAVAGDQAAADVASGVIEIEMKAGARLSKATRSALQGVIDTITGLVTADDSVDEPESKSVEAEAIGKASADVDDLLTRIKLLKET